MRGDVGKSRKEESRQKRKKENVIFATSAFVLTKVFVSRDSLEDFSLPLIGRISLLRSHKTRKWKKMESPQEEFIIITGIIHASSY